MSTVMDQGDEVRLAALAKTIADLDDLARVMRTSLKGNGTWQRQLDARLADVERLMQILRMTIAMERPDQEIAAAAQAVAAACRQAAASLMGSRADRTSLQAVALLRNLGEQLRTALD